MNTIGRVFRVTTWGESHSPAVGCVIDGCPAGVAISLTDLKSELSRDIPDHDLGTARREANEAQILSGVYADKTLGTPISILIYNCDCKSDDYNNIRTCYRPGHADYTYVCRYGIYHPFGGGRASGRECIARLCAGAVAKKVLTGKNISITSRIEELAGIPCEGDCQASKTQCLELADEGDSSGGIILLQIAGVPAGLGSPVFEKLHSLIIYAISTIGGVKAVECGVGFDAAKLKGSDSNDPFVLGPHGEVIPLTNKAGGVLGGISTGMDLIFRLAVKPTPSIKKAQKTVNWKTGREEEIKISGRFDKNFTPRVAVIAEAMAAIILVDQMILAGFIHPTHID